MLILTRKIGEVIVINNDIRVTVLDSDTTQVRIGIRAPRSVSVDREEIYLRKQNEFNYTPPKKNRKKHD